ncbi:RagB/SusD family nutrient uptake outer membrane protein [Hymenobacter antarcticus]|uniref:RagB/SusD domain-containing protein n=1 Tax=Hymenobacter antarcticus TaxID=486270 RepID=A0ABP7QW10_9BACT
MNKTFIRALLLSGVVASLSGCSYFEINKLEDPNFPTLASVSSNATKQQMDFLASGTFSDMRTNGDGIVWYHQLTGIIGREVYVLANSDGRYVTNPLGTAPFDNNNFLSGRYFTTYSSARRTARILVASANNTSSITEEQKNGYIGLGKTAEAYAMLVLSDLQYENGLRVEVTNEQKPGKIQPYPVVLAAIKTLLSDGDAALAKAGTTLAFPVPSGFAAGTAGASFNTVAGFRQYNRALAARLAIRSNNYADALAAITAAGSFFSNDALPVTAGPRFNYSATAGDAVNPLFQAPNAALSVTTVAHPTFRTDIRTGDTRINKIAARTTRLSRQGLSSNDDVVLYPTQTSPIPVIKREELLLIAAEANANTSNLPLAITQINKVGTAYGLPAYTGPITVAAVMEEILYQRRYSLFFEGQRWVDLRRLNKLDKLNVPGTSLPEKLSTGQQTIVLKQLPIPFQEIAWDQANPQ